MWYFTKQGHHRYDGNIDDVNTEGLYCSKCIFIEALATEGYIK